MTAPPLRRVGMLAPMEIELAPLTRELGLTHDGELHRGKAGDVDVIALVTTMGTAVDMETAAVAAVCERAGVPWSAFRGISDYAGEGLVDQELFEATNPDGTADRDAITRYLEAHPEKLEVLQRLAQDTALATEAAAAAAIRSCAPA